MIQTLAQKFNIGNRTAQELASFNSLGGFREGGIIKPFSIQTTGLSRVDKAELEKVFFTNSVVRNSIRRKVQMIDSAGYMIHYNSSKEEKIFLDFFDTMGQIGDDCDFDQIYTGIPKNQFIFGAGWNELVWDEDDSEIVDLNRLDPKRMDYARTNNNEIIVGPDQRPIGFTMKVYKGINIGKQDQVMGDPIPPEFEKLVDLGSDKIFLLPKRISLIRLEEEGDGLEFWGLIETIYKDSMRKGKLEEAGFNSAFQRWMAPLIAYIGDDRHPPTAQLANTTLSTMKKMKHDLLSTFPHYVKLDTVKGNEMESYIEMLKSLRENEASGLQMPMPFAMSSGETTNRACYSEDTLVLTDKGFMDYKSAEQHKIAVYDKDKDEIRLEKHTGLYEYDYDGEMIHFEGKSEDILVTPDHRMLFRKNSPSRDDLNNNKEWVVDTAENINTYYYSFKKNASWKEEHSVNNVIIPKVEGHGGGKEKGYYDSDVEIDGKLFSEFLGYYLSEGGLSSKGKSYTITFAQKGKYEGDFKKCFEKMPFHFTEYYDEKDEIWRWSVSDKRLWDFMKRYGVYCNNKKIDFNYIPSIYETFIAMMKGDGSWEREDKGYYSTTSEQLAKDFTFIAMNLGYSTNYSIAYETNGNRKKAYRVNLIKGRTEITHTQKTKKKMDYEGKVWCYNTSTGFFVTMRNGKVAIQGNTLNNQQAMLEFSLNALARLNAKLISKRIFRPIAESKGLDTYPILIPNRVSVDEIDDRAIRYGTYVEKGLFKPEELRPILAESEGIKLQEKEKPKRKRNTKKTTKKMSEEEIEENE